MKTDDAKTSSTVRNAKREKVPTNATPSLINCQSEPHRGVCEGESYVLHSDIDLDNFDGSSGFFFDC